MPPAPISETISYGPSRAPPANVIETRIIAGRAFPSQHSERPTASSVKWTHHGYASDRRHSRPRFSSPRDARPTALAERVAWAPRCPCLLSRGLESGVRRSDGALQRDPARVSEVQRRGSRHLCRRRLVSRSFCRGKKAAFSVDG